MKSPIILTLIFYPICILVAMILIRVISNQSFKANSICTNCQVSSQSKEGTEFILKNKILFKGQDYFPLQYLSNDRFVFGANPAPNGLCTLVPLNVQKEMKLEYQRGFTDYLPFIILSLIYFISAIVIINTPNSKIDEKSSSKPNGIGVQVTPSAGGLFESIIGSFFD